MSSRGRGGRGGRGRGKIPHKNDLRGSTSNKNWSTALPTSLESELIQSGSLKANYAGRGTSRGRGRGRGGGRGDKRDSRKNDREEAKGTRAKYVQHQDDTVKSKTVKPKPVKQQPKPEEPVVKTNLKRKLADESVTQSKKRVRIQEPSTTNTTTANTGSSSKITSETSTPLSRLLAKQGSGNSKPTLTSNSKNKSRVEQDEDQEIAWLEYHLGGSKARNELAEDGLDDLFDDLDQLEESLAAEIEGEIEYSDREADEPSSEEISEAEDGFDLAEPSDDETTEEELTFDQDEEEEEEWGGIGQSDPEELEEEGPLESPASTATLVSPTEVSEAPTTRYIPPALRQKTASTTLDSDHDPRLNRLLSGQLNKLSPQNIQILHTELAKLYTQHARAKLTTALTGLIVDRIAGSSDALGEIEILTVAALVASFFGAGIGLRESVITEALKRWDDSKSEQGGKERNNIVRLWSRFYNLEVLGCQMMYGVIKELIGAQSQELREEDVEALLVVIKTSGPKLRSDDPSTLKQIIQLVDEKRRNSSALSSRSRFMIEALGDLKNNRVKHDAGSSGTGSIQATEEGLKKFLQSLAKKTSRALPEPLRFTLDELRQSTTTGKWWQVGAAWSGNPLVDASNAGKLAPLSNRATAAGKEGDDKWAALAKKQGMNTDVRRGIFSALMGSEDYVDACDRISQLGMTEVQQREVVKVLLHCIGNERTYNPFYSLVMQRLLQPSNPASRSYAVTLQYSLWDLLREMGETQVGGQERLNQLEDEEPTENRVSKTRSGNIARSYGWWLAKGNLSLTILKPLPFVTLLPPSKSFLKRLLTTLLLATQSSTPMLVSEIQNPKKAPIEEVLSKIATNETVSKGLQYFLESEMGNEGEISELIELALDILRTQEAPLEEMDFI